MSRIGKLPVPILDGVKVSITGNNISVEGPKGKLSQDFDPRIQIKVDDETKSVLVTRRNDERQSKALHGLYRALVKNMIVGVKDGYEKKLELQGVGYVCSLAGNRLSMRVGLANELKQDVPVGLMVTCPDQTHINISGCDKQLVGQFAAQIRSLRKPEPYKGKGIRYVGEQIKLKPGKAAKA
ncbi:MAG: 50S ribosomal protein L6 [Pirellulaceae bacterium]|nr:50S ribosomal protein L6 [Pirellulaceae bacterium]